jgi:hypothetical protein
MASATVIIRNFKMATIIFMFTNISGEFFVLDGRVRKIGKWRVNKTSKIRDISLRGRGRL